jgi:aryl-alcohol dehydrogenase-like predicted oxidoreductase
MARSFTDRVTLGRSGLRVSRLGIGSTYGLEAADVEWAAERGINYFYWGAVRRPSFGRGLREIARRRRDETVIVLHSFARLAFALRPSVEIALRRLALDHADILVVAWWNQPPPASVVDAALALREAGKVRAIMISCHDRATFAHLIRDPTYGAIMVRYNAAHPGAEQDVFPHLDGGQLARPGVVAFTATRWGTLLDRRVVPAGEPLPRASDCYRFAIGNSDVDVTLCGPKNRAELAEALSALERGPLSEDELAWMRRVGKAVRDTASTRPPTLLQVVDGWGAIGGGSVKERARSD